MAAPPPKIGRKASPLKESALCDDQECRVLLLMVIGPSC